jgi:hypothetical protein
MARGPTSEADLLLIAELAAAGVGVSSYQLERWRRAGLLAKPEREWLGRGKGSTSRYPDDALEIAMLLAKLGAQGRSRHLSALVLFRVGLPVKERSVRDALAWVLQDDLRRVRLREQRNEYYVADLAHRAANAVTTDFPPLLAAAPPVGATRRQLKERARQRKQWQRFFGAKVEMKYGEVSGYELEEELLPLGRTMATFVADLVRQGEKERPREDVSSDEPESSTAHLAQGLPYDRLLAAREVLHRCAMANAALHELAPYYEEVRWFLADIGSEARFAELLILPGSLADGVSFPVAFAELVLGNAAIEPQLVQSALYAWVVNRVVAGPARGFELLAQYAHEHQVKLPELPSYEQVEMIGLLDFRQRGIEQSDLDLVDVLEEVGVPATPWIRSLQAEWTRLMSEDT